MDAPRLRGPLRAGRRAGVLALVLLATGALPGPGRLGPRAALAAGELAELVERLGAADATQRYPAYQELQRRRDPASVPLIVERIAGWDAGAQSYGVSLIDQVGGEPAQAAWKRLQGSAAPFVRGCAGLRLLATDRAKGSRLVVEALEGAKGDLNALLLLLGRLSSTRDEAVQAAVRALLVPATAPEVVGAALTHLAYANDPRASAAARALAEQAPARRPLVGAFLLRQGEEDLAGALAEALAAGEVTYAEFVRLRPWLEAAERLPAAVLEAVLGRLEKEPTAYYVASMIGLLAHARHAAALPVLRRLLDHADATVSKAAFDALAAFPDGLDAEALGGQLASPDASRRLAAADALRRADDRRGLPVVLELARAGSAVRGEAVRVLGGFRAPEGVEPLIEALLDDDLGTRAQAQTALSATLLQLLPYRRIDLASTGYATDAAPEVRRAAVDRLRAWWRHVKDRPW